MSVGTTILVDRKTAPLVVDSGILMEGRAQFIKLQAAGSGTLTIVNVYATQTSRNRALLWKTISKTELDFDNTIIGGNFNHQEETSHRGITGERQMHRREAASWHHMTLHYGLTNAWCSDSFRKMSKKAFTFDNGRLGANSAISRIDKFMGGRIESAITIRKFSDHSPFIISIWGQATGTDKPACYFDTSLLEEEKNKAALLQAWAGDSLTPPSDQGWAYWIEAAIKRVMIYNNCLAKAKRCLKGAMIRSHTEKIKLVEVQLQGDPTNEGVRDILSGSQAKLAEVYQNQVSRNQHLSSANWFRYDDTCSKNFFDFHKLGQNKTLLRELESESGTVNLISPIMSLSSTPIFTPRKHISRALRKPRIGVGRASR
jgi:hypothetical protein